MSCLHLSAPTIEHAALYYSASGTVMNECVCIRHLEWQCRNFRLGNSEDFQMQHLNSIQHTHYIHLPLVAINNLLAQGLKHHEKKLIMHGKE